MLKLPRPELEGGTAGGEVVFTGTTQEMANHSDSITAKYLRKALQ